MEVALQCQQLPLFCRASPTCFLNSETVNSGSTQFYVIHSKYAQLVSSHNIVCLQVRAKGSFVPLFMLSDSHAKYRFDADQHRLWRNHRIDSTTLEQAVFFFGFFPSILSSSGHASLNSSNASNDHKVRDSCRHPISIWFGRCQSIGCMFQCIKRPVTRRPLDASACPDLTRNFCCNLRRANSYSPGYCRDPAHILLPKIYKRGLGRTKSRPAHRTKDAPNVGIVWTHVTVSSYYDLHKIILARKKRPTSHLGRAASERTLACKAEWYIYYHRHICYHRLSFPQHTSTLRRRPRVDVGNHDLPVPGVRNSSDRCPAFTGVCPFGWIHKHQAIGGCMMTAHSSAKKQRINRHIPQWRPPNHLPAPEKQEEGLVCRYTSKKRTRSPDVFHNAVIYTTIKWCLLNL